MLKDKRVIGAIMIFSFIILFFYSYFVIDKFKVFSLKLTEVKNTEFNLPDKDVYLLKLWGLEEPKEVKFNQEHIFPFRSRYRGELKEVYFSLPPELVNKGLNRLDIVSHTTYSARIQNFIGKLPSADAFVLFNSSFYFKNKEQMAKKIILNAIFISFLLLDLWLFFSFWIKNYFNLEIKKFYFTYFSTYFLYFLSFFILWLSSKLTPYRVIMSSGYFISLTVFLIAIVQAPVIINVIVKTFLSLKKRNPLPSNHKLTINFIRKLLSFKFSDKAVLIFMVLFISCIFLINLQLELLAQYVADIAYLFLLVGVLIKFLEFVKKSNTNV